MFLRGGETVLSGKPPKIDGLAPEQVRKRPVIFTMQQFFDQRNEKKNLSSEGCLLLFLQAAAVVRLSKLPAFKELQAYMKFNRKVRKITP